MDPVEVSNAEVTKELDPGRVTEVEGSINPVGSGEDKSSTSALSSSETQKDDETPTAAGLSKKALKRIAKQAKWEEHKRLKRIKTRAKKKERNRRGAGTEFSRKALKRKTLANSKCRVGIVIDLSFDDLMIEKDVSKTVKQVHRCYSFNRRQPEPLQFHVTSFVGDSAKMMEKHDGFDNWDLLFHTEAYDEIFDKASIVYLTSDSENVIDKVEEDKYYIIGGLVDHNSRKGVCYDQAVKKGISHARLPIDEFLDMKTRKVLSINHVFEIMANVYRGMSWQESLISVIPPRKNAELKPAIDPDIANETEAKESALVGSAEVSDESESEPDAEEESETETR